MPRRPKKGVTPEDNKEALALLDLQKQEHQIAVARTALAEVLTLVHETSLRPQNAQRSAELSGQS